ncbi:Calcium-dependent lipid-binding family protein [Heracleum sosnowskyi]|uniref:Calcium-dependent lipid-binding family protein n=1 Tax=Heracleum sosnowskyi TaxID=360622 RepID=A0AAD8MQR4_9APIA|nr:Calcium-dependent lipid-binding family protein [Heracleum sosnowskyi]
MFEAHVLHLLRRYLGEYVDGLSAEALKISVWKGDVVLKDLKLKAEALNSLQLPVTVKAGLIGTITLKVPWKSLGKEPVIVLIDRVFVLARPAPDARSHEEEDREKLFKAKLQQIEEAESATLEAVSRAKHGSAPSGNSWLGSLIATIIGNLKITISNVHVRYEDSTSNPGNSFACGVTLAKLAAVTMDEQGNETFDTSGALDKLRKSVQLERLAMYHDSNQLPWRLDKEWEDLTPKEWIEIFEDGIKESGKGGGSVSKWAQDRNYLVSPINGDLKYHRLSNQEKSNIDDPSEKVSLVLTDVSLTITEAQYYDWIRLFEVLSRYKTYIEVSHIRPMVPVSENPYMWWRYAAQASLQQKRMCYRFSWDQVQFLCHMRRRYIQLYASFLQKMSNVDNKEMRDIEKDLDPKVILLWRFLAHAKVGSVRSKEEAEQRMMKKKSWFSYTWRTPEDALAEEKDAQTEDERLTKEEWQAINNLLSYQPDEDLTFHSGKDMQNRTQYLIDVLVGCAAAKIVNISQTEIVCGRFEQLHVSTKLKHGSTHCDLTLKYYGVSAPEGSLAQSGCDEQKVNALAASFVYSPIGENVDWRLSATISPCHATVFIESYDRFFEFLKRSKAVSPAVALETATALQNKLEKVTRRAQEQFQMVLEERSRFTLDIDLDAPKVRIPIRTGDSSTYDSQFLLDFGHFTLHTKESDPVDKRKSLYSRFYISGRDIAAFFTDCGSDSHSSILASSNFDNKLSLSPSADNFYSIVDRCGMTVIVDQIKVPHPSHPSTRIAVQMPTLGIHLSPVRYSRLLKLLDVMYGTIQNGTQPVDGNFQDELAPWNPPDLAAEAQILVWKGIGYSVATWKPCFIVLSGFYLYVLESETSQSYHRCSSMAGKHIFEVPPTNVGGSPSCIGVGARGLDSQKALESFSTLIIKFQDEEQKASWLRGLTHATYQASDLPSVDVLGQHDGDAVFPGTRPTNLKTADLVVNGTLMETKLSIYGKIGDEVDKKLKETLILEVLAGGGKVHVVRCEGNLTVKLKLQSLKIIDELQASLNSSPQYLACSVQKDNHSSASLGNLDPQNNDSLSTEEYDIFKDASTDFLSSTDSAEAGNIDKDPAEEISNSADVYYEAEDVENSQFVSLTFLTRTSGSPDYDGVDSQMIVCMSKLEFFFNRPTLVALIGFGLDMSAANGGSSVPDEEKTVNEDLSDNKMKIKDSGDTFVKGLLGYGKGRALFRLNVNVDSVIVCLNKEDGSQLAMFVQESFVLDLKVHPSSISLEGTLGNFRLCDLSLGSEHYWAWLCDIRNQGAESLIQFRFNSYTAEDDDYEGYDYSLQCRLSAVRIVFLYRFVQEITAYFMGLATPHTEEVVKYVDKVGGFEWLIDKNEIDGASALKLDLSLDAPIIIVPRNSMSKDFIQLDLGHLRVGNKFSWHGCPENDPSAVHLDILDAEIFGINMAVGIDGCPGKPLIREGQGIHINVRRSLRDVFRKVPTLSLEIKVGRLHCVMSDKEYTIILDCISENLSESPNLPPSFRESKADSKGKIPSLADKVNSNSQSILSRTVTIMAVEVDYALLELCNGIHEESPLAHIILEGLWVSYRMTSLSEADIYVTVPRFSVLDTRPDTKPEMRLMLGSCADISKQTSSRNNMNLPNSTMFVMDYRWRISSQLFVIRVQQPQVLVVPDFLLAVGEFLVPGLGSITGKEELTDPKNDPIGKKSGIVLLDPLYKQSEDVVHLSANSRLIADAPSVDKYTYDGCGRTIRLIEEKETKELHSPGFGPIIIIGRGKSLRFVNVKIENGFLLRKYTYLSNDSSYTVLPEDGVEILSLEDNFSGDVKRGMKVMEESLHTFVSTENSENDPSKIRSFSFEAQVVSPEFTFYDSSKSSLDDSTNGEKLLRAKLDFSFMYALKENDIWIRALFKDLTIEAGSGLIILDPVDISGGYTSVKDKTNISVISTDMYVHLSLSVISLVLNLQNQAAAALQYGNADLLSPCTHFDRIWVSPKGATNGDLNNLTFWRPRAPSNYVILGDCVTSRPIPPSYTVMAVSSTYGRVRKPLRFELLGLFSAIQGGESSEGSSNANGDCSIWIPIPPQGYTALGCVAHRGSQPPPTHIVHCVRSDLVTSARYSECIFSTSANQSFLSGFSIWHLDNVVGSFYAHPSTDCPPINICRDLNHLVLLNSSQAHISYEKSSSDLDSGHDYEYGKSNSQGANSSRWDIVKSISRGTSYVSTSNFERIWWDKGSDIGGPVSIWRPLRRPGYAILGDCIVEGFEPPALGIIFKVGDPEISAKPVQFTQVAHIAKKGVDDAFLWYPIAPPGYASIGCVVSRTEEAPALDSFCCPRIDLVRQANIHETPVSRSSSARGSQCWSLWKVDNQAYTFLASSDMKRPFGQPAFTVGDSVRPKTQDNINAEMKLRCLSVTVLDSLCGTMTPLFDVTISNIKLATHGRLEALNAVLISSTAASTFNTQLETWEPLVEPFDGIFKFETYGADAHSTSRFCKRARVAATTTLNINLSTANLNMFLESVISWRRQREFEHKASEQNEEQHRQGDDPSFSALDEEDLQTVIIENKLGCDIYLKKAEQDSDAVRLLCHDDYVSLWIPPPRYTDRLNVADETREARCYAAVQIIKAKDLPIIDDGNGHKFFCALRLVVDSQETNQRKLPQSARTRCVRPSVSRSNGVDEGTACWNELFIFEVPRKGLLAKLEVEVTNLAAKAGKGEVVGASSFSIGHSAKTLKKMSSVKMLHQASEVQNIAAYPLKIAVLSSSDDIHSRSSLLVSTSYFEIANIQTEFEEGSNVDRDIGFRVGLSPKGSWESFRSFLPLSVITKTLSGDSIAVDVILKNGKKHAVLRSLVTIWNDSDIKLEVSIGHASRIHSHNLSEDIVFNTLNPGSSFVLPWKSTSKGSDCCLLLRPCTDGTQPPYSWGNLVNIGYTLGKDQQSSESGSLSRQNTVKHGNQRPTSSFNLSQLEKTDVFFCSGTPSSDQFWLSVSTDASALHTELNIPIYDWKISVNSPLKLENRLPCPARFIVWEKSSNGNHIERQRGFISSRGTVNIHSADVQKLIYVTLFMQGGWSLEKDPVLVLDLSSNSHVSSFWMVRQQGRRRLRVSIDRDMGGSIAAPKTIRFFVPYWISNDSSLPLAYQVVEIEPLETSDVGSRHISKKVKSGTASVRSPKISADKNFFGSKKNLQVLEVIEDTSPTPSMLSPQEYVGRGGVVLFSSRNDGYLSPRVGIAVSIRNSENYSPGISLLDLEKKQRVDVRAYKSDGSYYNLSAVLHMTSDRTKVIHFQQQTLFINRVGCSICLQQCDTQSLQWIHPTDPPLQLGWQSLPKTEMLRLRIDGYNWSTPFSVGTEGVMCVSLNKVPPSDPAQLRVEVRSGTMSSHYEVIFRPNSFSSPYRIENHSLCFPIRFQQVDGPSSSWKSLLPNSSASFLWEDLGRPRQLELLVDGDDRSKSLKYNIDEISDHYPVFVNEEPTRALRINILREDKVYVIKISDWMLENESEAAPSKSSYLSSSQILKNDTNLQQSRPTADSEFHVSFEISELGLSIIDHTPEELLYLSLQSLLLSYSTGLGSGMSRLKLRMRGIQVDNQLPLTPTPVLFRPQRVGDETDYVLKFSMIQQSNGSLDLCVYPYIGFQGPENLAFLISIHEPIIWRLHGMIQQINLSRVSETETTAVSVDPIIQIGAFNFSELRLKVSMSMSPTQRPVGVLGFWASLMTALGNTENMPIRINERFLENICMRQSMLISNAISNVKKDLLSQPLQLLSGVDILGNASSALGHMSKGVAALSMDKKFIQNRQKQDSKGVEDFGDVIREGGGALAKGFFRGFTGILTKPLEGAKASGVEGFVQGVGKGIIGVAAQPVSGVLDLLSKTTEGANAVRIKIASAIASEDQLLRRRLPRVIGGDNLLRPYDAYKAQGQVILQLAESVSFLRQVDLFKVRGKFALSDAYEDHFLLPKAKYLLVTHRRIILLQQSSSIIGQKKFDPARDPCSVLWDVLWDNLMTMELTHGKKDLPDSLPSRVVLYLKTRSLDPKDQVRIIKCNCDSNQAVKVYTSIEHATNTYGPNQSKDMLKWKVAKPYSPIVDAANAEAFSKYTFDLMSPQQMPSSGVLSSTFGSGAN